MRCIIRWAADPTAGQDVGLDRVRVDFRRVAQDRKANPSRTVLHPTACPSGRKWAAANLRRQARKLSSSGLPFP